MKEKCQREGDPPEQPQAWQEQRVQLVQQLWQCCSPHCTSQPRHLHHWCLLCGWAATCPLHFHHHSHHHHHRHHRHHQHHRHHHHRPHPHSHRHHRRHHRHPHHPHRHRIA